MSSLISTRDLSTFFTCIFHASHESQFSSILSSHPTYPLNEPIPSNTDGYVLSSLYWGQTLLHYIISTASDTRPLEILIQHARDHNKVLDPHARDRISQDNALHRAAKMRRCGHQTEQDILDCHIIDHLISLGVTPNAITKYGDTALMISIIYGRQQIIHHLIDRFHPSNPHVRIPIHFHIRNDMHDNVFDIANDIRNQLAGQPKPHIVYYPSITAQQFTDIIVTVNRKYHKLHMKGMFQLLLGTHPRIGINSSLRTFYQSHRFDPHLFPLIYSFLYCPLPTSNAQLAQLPIPSPPPPNPNPCSLSGCLSTAHLICTPCHKAHYCSQYCQAKDWEKHKATCEA